MASNILIAIKNLVQNPVVALTAHYSGRNSVNGVGNAVPVNMAYALANKIMQDLSPLLTGLKIENKILVNL